MLDFRTSEQLEFDVFSIPFDVTPTCVSLELQLELIKLQSDDTLRAMYHNKPLLEFYSVYVSKNSFQP